VSVQLKSLRDQVMVITGASSGIGLATARMAAAQGAKVVVTSRNAPALTELADELRAAGGDALANAADVGHQEEIEAVAKAAVERYGRIDTWVNNAGASVYGDMTDIPMADFRRVIDTNFWGVVNGSLVAARHFKTRGGSEAGALINIGSVLSDRAVPFQGMYCASKHAVKGFTDSLRMELEEAKVPVSVTLVKPSSIDTPFPQHAGNYMDEEPTLPPPLYSPDVVARAILHCAATPERDVTVGFGGKAFVLAGAVSPRTTDRGMEATMRGLQKKGEPPRNPAGTLHRPSRSSELKARGDYHGPVLKSSVYTTASLHPVLTAALAVGAGLAAVALLSASASKN